MKGSRDTDLIKIRNYLLVGIAITGVVIIFIILFFKNGLNSGPITKKMNDSDTFLIYIENDNCDKCNEIKSYLDDNNVSYEELNEYDNEAKKIFKKYDFVTDNSISPAVIYVSNGKVYSSLVNLNNTEELTLFLKNYNLSK